MGLVVQSTAGSVLRRCLWRRRAPVHWPQSFSASYHAEFPLDPGYATRKHLYNLYHVLNHLNLFGGGYGAQAERMIGQLLAQA